MGTRAPLHAVNRELSHPDGRSDSAIHRDPRARPLVPGRQAIYRDDKALFERHPEDEDLRLQFDPLQIAGDAYRQTLDNDILQSVMDFIIVDDDLLQKTARNSLVTALASEWEQLTPNQRSDLRDSFGSVDYVSQARKRLTS